EAVASPQRLSNDLEQAHRLLDLVTSVPMHVWGRDETGADDMWTSNSVISWLIIRSGLPAQGIGPPTGGSAPGWDAGVVAASAGRAREFPGNGGCARTVPKPRARLRRTPGPPLRREDIAAVAIAGPRPRRERAFR